jgi:hypothetical protein
MNRAKIRLLAELQPRVCSSPVPATYRMLSGMAQATRAQNLDCILGLTAHVQLSVTPVCKAC